MMVGSGPPLLRRTLLLLLLLATSTGMVACKKELLRDTLVPADEAEQREDRRRAPERLDDGRVGQGAAGEEVDAALC